MCVRFVLMAESLGRVVTLLPDREEADPASTTHGTAYFIPREVFGAVMARLLHREKAGYVAMEVEVIPTDGFNDGTGIMATTFIATKENEFFLGESDPREIARTISTSVGPSGTNLEYFQRLREA